MALAYTGAAASGPIRTTLVARHTRGNAQVQCSISSWSPLSKAGVDVIGLGRGIDSY